MASLHEVGERDGWRCWLCDEPVDPDASVNSDLGPSVDSALVVKKGPERLAHRQCNTKKGRTAPVVAWPDRLLVADPAPLVATVDRLSRKGGREVVGRCPSREDADEAAAWLVDRLSRFAPQLRLEAEVQAGGGQHLVVLRRA